jgi:hypothetical protein
LEPVREKDQKARFLAEIQRVLPKIERGKKLHGFIF